MWPIILGDWDRAEALRKEYEAAIADAESHVLQGEMLHTQAAMALARGDALALDYAQRSLAHGRRVKDPQAVGPSLAELARVLVEHGRPADAMPLVDELLSLTDDEGTPLYYTWLIDLGWLLHDLGREDPPPRGGRAPAWTRAGSSSHAVSSPRPRSSWTAPTCGRKRRTRT